MARDSVKEFVRDLRDEHDHPRVLVKLPPNIRLGLNMALIEVMEQDGLEGAYILAREVGVSLKPVLEKYGIQASVLAEDVMDHLEDVDTDFVFLDSLEDLSEDTRKRVADRLKELKQEGITVFVNGKEGMEDLLDPDETVEPGEGIKG